MTSPIKIPIHVSNQKGYIWDADDAAFIRRAHHLLGMLTGTLPSVAQQNVFLGLPLLLMPEEVVLLVEKGVGVILDNETAHRPPSEAELATWKEAAVQDRATRIQASESIRLAKEKSLESKHSEQAIQKRREREQRKLAKALAAGGDLPIEENGAQTADLTSLLATEITPTMDRSAVAQSDPPEQAQVHTIIIPGTSADHPWFTPKSYGTLEAASKAGVWNYPSTPLERAKCAVFMDLNEKGYFLGGGIKFGGDWLVYPGDMLRYHSHFVATVYATPTSKLTPMQIVAFGRLGTGTKKAHLLCGWDEETDQVDYYSIEWANFG